jgi:hypothetical protein
MANFVLDGNFHNFENVDNDDIDGDINDIYEYKGYFLENNIDDDEEDKFYEFGAHFPYSFLYQKLEILAQNRKVEEENLKERNKNMKENNENNIQEETDFFSFFNKNNNKKSRNRNNNNDNFTNQPFINNKEIEEQKIRTYIEKNVKKPENIFSNKKNKSNKLKKLEIKNIEKKNNNISTLILNTNKLKEKNFNFFEKHSFIGKMNLYTSFAKILKMNRNINFSKKETNNEEDNSINNKSNSNKKVRSIQLSKKKLNKILHSSTQSKNHLEKRIKTVNNTFKKSFSKSKENSILCHHNNNSNKITNKNIQNQIIANSLNNLLTHYKNKRNYKLSPKNNHPTFSKKQFKNPNVSKNKNKQKKVDKFIKKICKENSSSYSKKKKILSNEGKAIDHNKTQEIKDLIFNKKIPVFHSQVLKEMLDSINLISYNKSRNKNYLKNNLTGTKSILLTDREKNKKKGPLCINNKNIILHTQTANYQNNNKSKNSEIINEKEKEINIKEKNIKNSKNNSIKKDNDDNNQFKTYLDIKFNLYQKTRNNVINELKKSIGINSFTFSQLSNKIHKKNFNSSKSKNKEKVIKNNNPIKNSKINFSKNLEQINININIHNDNEIYYNKIYNENKNSEKSFKTNPKNNNN